MRKIQKVWEELFYVEATQHKQESSSSWHWAYQGTKRSTCLRASKVHLFSLPILPTYSLSKLDSASVRG